MAVTLTERPESRRVRYGVNGRTETLVFNGKGSTQEVDYIAAVLAIPDTDPGGKYYNNFVLEDIELEPIDGRRYRVLVNYGTRGFAGTGGAVGSAPLAAAPPLGSSSTPGSGDAPMGPGYSMEIGARTERRTQSIETLAKRVVGGGAVPDNKNAIGLSKDKVEGCDVYVPTATWTKVAARANAACTINYTKTLKSLVGKNNNALFYMRAAGECIYLGASMAWNGTGYTFTHKFEDRDLVTNLIIVRDPDDPANPIAPNAIGFPGDVSGWDHIWTAYEVELRNDEVAPKPFAAYQEKVIEDADFGLIGIGE